MRKPENRQGKQHTVQTEEYRKEQGEADAKDDFTNHGEGGGSSCVHHAPPEHEDEDASFRLGALSFSKTDADESTAAVSNHDCDGQGNYGQRKDNRIGCVPRN